MSAAIGVPNSTANAYAQGSKKIVLTVSLLKTFFWAFLLFTFYILDNLAKQVEDGFCSWQIVGNLEVYLLNYLWQLLRTDYVFVWSAPLHFQDELCLISRLQRGGLGTDIQAAGFSLRR